MQKQRKEAKSSPRNEEMDIATNPSPVADESSSAPTAGAPTADAPSTEPTASTAQGISYILFLMPQSLFTSFYLTWFMHTKIEFCNCFFAHIRYAVIIIMVYTNAFLMATF